MKRSFLSVAGIIVLAAILVLFNGISKVALSRFYVDLTEEKLYTLSSGSRNIIGGVEAPITLRYYYSKTDAASFPALRLYADRVVDLLRQYERVGKGKIVLENYDPRSDSEEAEWAEKYGLSPIGMPDGTKLYFGLVGVNEIGEEQAIPVFNIARQEFVEYDITKLIYNLGNPDKPKVGILSSLDVRGTKPNPQAPPTQLPVAQPWVFVNQLNQVAEVSFIDPTAPVIDAAIDVLVLIHPKELDEKMLYVIDQFVLRGGSLFVAVDPYCQEDHPAPNPQNPAAQMSASRSSDLNQLLEKWGIKLETGKAVGDISLAAKVFSQQGRPPEDYVLWLAVNSKATADKEILSRSDVITSNLENLLLRWPGALVPTEVEGVSVEPLITTTTESKLFEEKDYRFGGGTPQSLLRGYSRSGKRQILAAKISGKFSSNFDSRPEGAVADQHLKESVNVSNVVVIADADFLSDSFSVRKQNFLGTTIVSLANDNLIFAQNVIENLSGSSDLISLRSRGKFQRPFGRVQEIERRAAERWRQEESLLQAKLNAANQRLTQLMSASGAGGEKGRQVFNQALMEEVRKFREERLEAQKKFREVRRKRRQEVERLEDKLFLINTFLVPLLLIALTLGGFWLKRRKRGA